MCRLCQSDRMQRKSVSVDELRCLPIFCGGEATGQKMNNEPLDLGNDKSLLLVDDDEAFLRRLAKAMEKRGFEVSSSDT